MKDDILIGAMVVVAVGTTNKAKVKAVEDALSLIWPNDTTIHKVIPVAVVSCVRAQPMTDDETIEGAVHRAKSALSQSTDDSEVQYGIGIEGGVNKVGDHWFEFTWVVIVDRKGNKGIASTSRYELPTKVMEPLIAGEKELSQVMDEITCTFDVRSNQGAMGVYTNNILNRSLVCTHAVVFAFSKFFVKKEYWY
ncbi:hypothetical protein PPL_05545 [Heterostelium album PN500]|uniref:inosine/xanthosine triphosphatase n=1 Tax=Heterostelium pallidum (strain ATCC 26659 / Pp 5 / PN500) TaxID=670386 RepID=D3BAG9_HETP5|nr:hypothetical protein PPL_05545 [Heterostelium album PN500]EFA81556.1 hypothetical protein PPL_05545 [Heterostelium album PN500]|eukprot:XP_020433673.1 hypothetical protein PPL_05545 [Heterostelium album PN500]